MKNDLDSHVCYASVASPSSLPIACTSFIIENDINNLKKSVDCLGSTLSHCALNHSRLESMFRKKQVLLCMRTNHGIHMLLTYTPITQCMLMCTLVHICGRKGHLAKFCYDKIHDVNLATKFV